MTKIAKPEKLKKPRLNVVMSIDKNKAIKGKLDIEPVYAKKTPVCFSIYHKLIPLIIILILIIIFFGRLFFPQTSLFMIPDFGESDVLHLNFPLKHLLSSSLKNNQWPLWTPYLSSGFPLLAEGQIGTFYLPNLVLFKFLPAIIAFNLNLVIAFILAAVGTYLFLKTLKLSSVSSFFGAIIFTFSGFLSVHLNHFNLIQAASLTPLLFWSSLKLWLKPKLNTTILLAFLLSQQIFTGHFYIVFITLVGLFTFFTIYCLVNTTHCSVVVTLKRLYFVLISFVVTLLLSSIQLLPTFELWRLSERAGGLDFNNVTAYPYPYKHLLAFIKPYAFGDPARGTYPQFTSDWGIFWENTAYMGILPLILGILSIFFLRDKIVKINLGLLTVSLLLVLGKYSPLYFIFSLFPFNLFRVPSKFLLLTTFTLTILSVYVFEQIIRLNLLNKALKFILVLIFFLSVFFDEYRFSYNYPPVTPANWWLDKPPAVDMLEDKNAKVASLGAPAQWNSVFLKDGWQDMTPYVFFRNNLYPNYNVFFNLKNININTGGLIPRRLHLYNSWVNNLEIEETTAVATLSSLSKNLISLSATKYIITPYVINDEKLSLINKIPHDNLTLAPINVYLNNDALPTIYFAGKTQKVTTLEGAMEKIGEQDFISNQIVLVEDDNLILDEDRGEVKLGILKEEVGKMVLNSYNARKRLLVITDSNYPGWKAWVNNKEVPIYTVNLTQKGIVLPAGNNKVELKFQSLSFAKGKTITFLTMLITSAVVFLSGAPSLRKAFDKRKLSGCL